MTCEQGLLRLLWGGGGAKLECYGTDSKYSEVAPLDDVANLPSIIEEILFATSNVYESSGLCYLTG